MTCDDHFTYYVCNCEDEEIENQGNNTEKKDEKSNLSSIDNEEQIKYLKNKLQRTQAKLCESRNTCATLRQEINKAQKVLMFLSLYEIRE